MTDNGSGYVAHLYRKAKNILTRFQRANSRPALNRCSPAERSPSVAKIFSGDGTVSYAFVNADWVNSTGYSALPIRVLERLMTDGKIGGVRLMGHHEPIVLIGIPLERNSNFIRGYVGRDVLTDSEVAASERPAAFIVSGASRRTVDDDVSPPSAISGRLNCVRSHVARVLIRNDAFRSM